MAVIKYNKVLDGSYLRNGFIKTSGIELGTYEGSDTIDISAITSRGNVANGWIRIPKDKETLGAVIKALQDIKAAV